MDNPTANDPVPIPTPTPVPELTVTQWYAADIAARAAFLVYGNAELQERVLRRTLDERRLLQEAVNSTATEHLAAATAAMAAAMPGQSPMQQSQDYIVTELVAAQVIGNKPTDVLGAVTMAKVIRQLTTEPRIYPSPT